MFGFSRKVQRTAIYEEDADRFQETIVSTSWVGQKFWI